MSDAKIKIMPLSRAAGNNPPPAGCSLEQLLFHIEVLRGGVLVKDEYARVKQEVSAKLDEIRTSLLDFKETNLSRKTQSSAPEKALVNIKNPDFIGDSGTIRSLMEESARWAVTPYPVLITGESGTGKEMFARLIHQISGRNNFLPVNCGAIPSNLIESELFGYTRGAFTGAHQNRAGKFEEADGGTLFLDEIGELEEYIQVKLLRAVQFGEIQRLGSDKVIHVQTRVIAATNRNIHEQIASGRLRSDLYYRLACFELRIPPLRERREEIPDLLSHFMRKCAAEVNKTVPVLSLGLKKYLYEEYRYPGNIRELENIARRVTVSGDGSLGFHRESLAEEGCNDHDRGLAEKVKTLTRDLFITTLKAQMGSVPRSAAILGISQSRFYQLCRSYGLKPVEFKRD